MRIDLPRMKASPDVGSSTPVNILIREVLPYCQKVSVSHESNRTGAVVTEESDARVAHAHKGDSVQGAEVFTAAARAAFLKP